MQINTEWTEELLTLMFMKRLERIKNLEAARQESGGVKRVSNEAFFQRHGIKVTKHAPRD